MTLTDAHTMAAALLEDLPQQIHDALERVDVQVVDLPPPGVPSDAKAIFLGHQQEGSDGELEEDDDADAGDWYDIDPEDPDELVLVDHVGMRPAEGTIVLVSSNLADAEDLEIALYHEMGHALGMDEQEVAELGLG